MIDKEINCKRTGGMLLAADDITRIERKVDILSETANRAFVDLGVISQRILNHDKEIEKCSIAKDRLYVSRDDHEKRIVKIETSREEMIKNRKSTWALGVSLVTMAGVAYKFFKGE